MTSRLALLAPLALFACDRAPAPPAPEPDPSAASFDNEAAGQSIVRPEVIAEVEPTPTPTPTPAPLPRATVAFTKGTALDDAGRAALDQLLGAPGLPADARFVLRGHSDTAGSDRDNLVTSRKRAEAVRAYLEGEGIGRERVEVIALGERRPVAPNATLGGEDDPAGRARNRRVDVEVLAGEAPTTPASPGPSPTPAPTGAQD